MRRAVTLVLLCGVALLIPAHLIGAEPAATSGRPPTSGAAAHGSPRGIHKIRHVVIIMQENRSFDSYFGTYPGADGIPGLAVMRSRGGVCEFAWTETLFAAGGMEICLDRGVTGQ